MGLLSDLYRLKLKVFFGALKASKKSIILLLIFCLGMVPGAIGIAMSSVQIIKRTSDLAVFINDLSAVLAGFIALSLLSTYRGVTVFEYEQSFILTSPITPRQFLVASLFADMTVSLLFLYPFPILVAVTVFSLGLSFTAVISIALASLLLFLFAFLIRSSLSILRATCRSTSLRTATTALIFILLFPALGIFTPIPIKYDVLPYPTTFVAKIILSSLSNGAPLTISFIGLSLYFLISLILFHLSSKRNFFQFASPVPLISPFDTSMRMQVVKADKNIRLFSPVGLKITLTPDSSSLLIFLMKKEFIRMLRDGSLFAMLLLYVIASVITVVGTAKGMPMPIWLFLLALYSFIVPPMLVSNWRIVELESLWIPLTSGMNLSYLAKSMLYDFTIIASIIPVAIILAISLISRVDPLTPLVLVISVSIIGCSTNLYTVMHFLSGRRRATPSMIISWISILLTGLLLSPVYAFVIFSLLLNFGLEVNIILSVLSLLYSILIFIFLSKAISKKALSIEL